MTTLAQSSAVPPRMGWLSRAEAWLDARGKGAWIAAMILSFILFWPIGLALLAYMIWSNKMSCTSSHSTRHCSTHRWHRSRSTGNSAFDSYRAETLRRLEEEQQNFEAFLQRLRDARDKAEFDQFMEERATAATSEDDESDGPDLERPREA